MMNTDTLNRTQIIANCVDPGHGELIPIKISQIPDGLPTSADAQEHNNLVRCTGVLPQDKHDYGC